LEQKKAKIIAITNQKGGVAKTTTAVNLAASWALLHQRVCLVDIDPQGNASHSCGAFRDTKQPSLNDLLLNQADLQSVLCRTSFGFDLLPGGHTLTVAAVRLLKQAQKERVLAVQLSSLVTQYDFIIIDTPPSLNILTVNALVAANAVLIPVQCEYFALEGLAGLLSSIDMIQRTVHPHLKIAGILRTMYDGRNRLAQEVSMQLKQHFGALLCQTVIPRNVRLAEAPSHGMPAIKYAMRAQGALAYLALAQELLSQMTRKEPCVEAL
jgi:chromosome partitioning protein